MLTLAFPNIDKVIFSVGPLSVHWYSLSYIFGILLGWLYINALIDKFKLEITKQQISDFITWAIIGIIIGGRLGYVFIYDPVRYLQDPIDILKTYDGGMSFHSGALGIIISTYFFCKKNKIQFFTLMDLIAAAAPIGLFLGRIANFINAELYGRVTNVPWAVIFPGSDMQPRHPSQLYEAFAEGLLLFGIMLCAIFCFNSIKVPSRLSAMFLILYAIMRSVIENFREPDAHIGFIFAYVTMGQILSIIMLIVGVYLIMRNRCLSTPKLGN